MRIAWTPANCYTVAMAAATDIVLATLNARYIHSSLGLRCLHANLGELASDCQIMEFNLQTAPLAVAEAVLSAAPALVGLGVYVWNATETLAVVRLLKVLRPELVIVLGGPEISYEWQEQELYRLADHVVLGEGELAFADLCRKRLAGEVPEKLLPGGAPDLARLMMPYPLYSDADIADRVLYVEASRGCPYRCAFCLSALDKQVRPFPTGPFIDALQQLLDRGGRSFKFVDRTFNLSPHTSEAILRFFLPHAHKGLHLHFEMVPDRFPKALRELIASFPAGTVQLEVGVQSLDPAVTARIDRPQNNVKIFDNLRFLVHETGVHVHADLIVGLPGEDLASFGRGFDTLLATGVQEIQVGMLKRLRGAPIAAHTATWGMLYSPLPPYEVLRTAQMSEQELAQMRRFARCWDVFGNSGRYARSLPLLLSGPSAFAAFARFAEWLYGRFGRTHSLEFQRCVGALFAYLHEARQLAPGPVATALAEDYQRVTRKPHIPDVLRPHVVAATGPQDRAPGHLPGRQRRHLSKP